MTDASGQEMTQQVLVYIHRQ